MTAARRTLAKMTCPTCHREVGFRYVGGPRQRGNRVVEGIRVPVAHHNPQGQPCQPTKRPP